MERALLLPPPPDLETWLVAGVALSLGPGDAACHFPALVTGGLTVVREGAFLAAPGHALPPAVLSGASTAPRALLRTPVLRFAGLVLRPPAMAALAGGSPGALVDALAEPRAVFGPGWDGWQERIAEAPSEAQAVALLFAFVRSRLEGSAAGRHLQHSVRLQHLAVADLRSAGPELGCSERQFERRFDAAFGLRPKRFQRIARVEGALRDAMALGRCDAEVALRHGYYDQSHLGRDLRELVGAGPGELLSQLRTGAPAQWPLRIGAGFGGRNGIRPAFGPASVFS